MQWAIWLVMELIFNVLARRRPVMLALGFAALAGVVVLGMIIQAIIPHH